MELDYRHVLESLLTLSNDSITLRNKIVFAAILIFLVTLILYLIQRHYSVSYRDSLTPVDLLVSTSAKFYYYESFYQEQIEIMSSSIF
jgi:hypothetical protein